MCGIAGYINTSNKYIDNTDVIRKMLLLQKHRGPDDSGIMAFNLGEKTSREYRFEETQAVAGNFDGMLGFNRLSIMDLSKNGHQPMCSPDGQVILTMNGEIYNAFDLKPALEADGNIFKSTTDTEVVLYLYLKYGFQGMIEQLNGMFAIAIIDLRESRLYLARDRFGIKPMYYYNQNAVFAFSSELKSFYALPEFKAHLNYEQVDEYMLYRNTMHKTLIKDVLMVEPGCYYIFETNSTLKKKQYFNINEYNRTINTTISFEETQSILENDLKTSVESQLMSDVKLGCQLSGGVDSTLVTWLAKEIKQDNLLESVSIVFDNDRFSEKKYIDQVANQLSIVSHQFPLQADYYSEHLQKATWHFEQPINHPNTIGIYLLAQRSKEFVTVLLSGEGADEVFGGYSRFYSVLFPFTNRNLFAGLKNSKWKALSFLKEYSDPFFRANINGATMKKTIATSLKPDFNYTNASQSRRQLYDSFDGRAFDRQVKYDIATYLPDLLMRQDKMSMAHSIENRVPFLDNTVVQKSFDLPVNHLIKFRSKEGFNTEKYLLKKICAHKFGNQFAFRNKVGFGIPIREFMQKKGFNDFLRDQIIPKLKTRGLFNMTIVEYWLNNLQVITKDELEALWVISSFEIWMSQYIDEGKIGVA
jgi:asparagine synthase (glutamine-hydrolysing)